MAFRRNQDMPWRVRMPEREVEYFWLVTYFPVRVGRVLD